MSIRSILLLILALVLVAFAILNWGLITQPAALSLLVGTVNAPLGLILLGFIVVMALVFVALQAYAQTIFLMEGHRHTKELAAQRELADNAEASRFTELKTFVAEEMVRLSKERADTLQEVQARMERMQTELVQRVDEQANSLAALVGQLEDHVRGVGSRSAGAT